jgi:hypothetical protein
VWWGVIVWGQLDREEREKEEMRFRKNMEVRLFLDEQSKVQAHI